MTTTRFAPSPTGYIHVGNLRTALMNYMIARKSGGSFILRLDDTDQERSKQEYIDGLMQDLDWLGLHWDRVEQQSKRMDRYAEAADQLRAAGRFYECFESPVELDLKRKKQLNMHKPPVYDRSSLHLSAAEKDAMRAERAQNRTAMPMTAEDQRLRRDAKQGSDDLLRALMQFFEKRAILQNSIARQDVTT